MVIMIIILTIIICGLTITNILLDYKEQTKINKKIYKLGEQLTEREKQFNEHEGNIKKRDYLIRTDFLGKLTDKNLIKDFKECEIVVKYKFIFFGEELISIQNNNYNKIKQMILDYDFYGIEAFCKKLSEYEQKQEVLDEYGKKETNKIKEEKDYE